MGESEAKIDEDPLNTGNKVLKVADLATDGKPTVSRAFTSGPAESGSLKTSIYLPSDSTSGKSVYLMLANKPDSSGSSSRFAEVYFTTKATFRGEDGVKTDLGSVMQDQWIDVSITWDRYDDSTYGVTVMIDDVVHDELMLPATAVTPEYFTIYAGDTNSTGIYAYFDDLGSELFE